jgi:polyhydroxybutyrate depolymerase
MAQSITVDGMPRTFVRHIPPGYTGRTPAPVVIDFHPLGSTGSSWKGATGWSALADREGFIVIWPDGVGNSWNVGRCCRTAFEQNVDDVAFTKAIISTLAQEACIDTERVYATGCSNGGGMAFKVACDAADVIAAVAPVDFDCVTSEDANDRSCGANCAPSRPISEIQFRGTADTVVPYEGGIRSGGMTTFPGAEQTFMSFGSINMCQGGPEALPDHASCRAYPTCGGDVDTILCTVQNGTHCGSYQSFGIANIAWDVFKTKSLPWP